MLSLPLTIITTTTTKTTHALSFFATIIYNKPTRCNSGSIVFINNYKYALHVSDVLCQMLRGLLI